MSIRPVRSVTESRPTIEGAGVLRAGEAGVRFLLVSGALIREPIAWRGPIVMNTQEELRQAYRELQEGTFIRNR